MRELTCLVAATYLLLIATQLVATHEGVLRSRMKRGAWRRDPYDKNIWKNGVYYFYEPSMFANNKMTIDFFERAVQAWQKDTCINFTRVASERSARDTIRVTPEIDMCYSYLGRSGGMQNLYLGPGCNYWGVYAHELGHALGLIHTMMRHDRDKYITTYEYNLGAFKESYDIKTEEENENYGIGYDYGSIMHYPRRHFIFNDQPSVKPTDSKHGFTMGSQMIAYSDLLMLNKHYSCEEICKNDRTTIKCKNGGIPHPRQCSKCLCPGGYGGKDCSQRPDDGCGREFNATKQWQHITLKISNPRPRDYLDFYKKCTYWIKGPEKARIQVLFRSKHFRDQTDGCALAGVEIKTNRDQILTGYRRCSNIQGKNKSNFISYKNFVPVIMYSRDEDTSSAVISFRYLEAGETGDDF